MKHSILCVDDEVDNVESLERLFRRKYKVFTATSGVEALRVLERERISLIVTDQRMPGMTGVELLAASREHQPDAIRILLTGYTDIDSVIAAVNSGQIYRYVTKPWDPVDLGNAVDKAIERFELSAELKEKNEALETALRELRTLDQAKSNFMILINHELKTPLTAILSFLGLLQETELDEEQTKYVTRIAQSGDRLRALIEDSLELVAAETGTLPVKLTKTSLQKMIGELGKDLGGALSAKSLSLRADVGDESVRTDPKVLRSVLNRLVDNAVKFSFEKGVIEFSTEVTDDDRVRVRLVNEGKAVKSEVIEKILRPFALDEDVMHHSKGTGLGLSVAQAVLRRLGSGLEITTRKTRFEVTFTLPSA
jgi:signal transduction histidine kinase